MCAPLSAISDTRHDGLLAVGIAPDDGVVADERTTLDFVLTAEPVDGGLGLRGHRGAGGVVGVEHGEIGGGLVFEDARLGGGVVLE